MPKGGGGAHTTNGATGTRNGDGQGGVAYATLGSFRLYPGSAGGKGGCLSEVDGTTCGGIGGNGGGVITILAGEVAMPNGVISTLGEGGSTASGSGAGGSIRVEGENISLGQALVAGGLRNVAGGNGSSYAIYLGTITEYVFGSALDLDGPTATPGPTPTPTAVPTLNPASAVWHTRVYNYGSAHPNRVTGTSEMDTYTYDENGNQVTRLVDGVSWTLAYNAENRLANVSDGNGASEGYLYDGDGVRVARVRPGEATYLFMGGLYEVTLALPSGTVTGSRSYYTVEGQMLAMSDGSSTSYLLTDHLGSVVGVVDGSGALVSEQRYLPFGEARTDLSGITATDLSFTGQRALIGTGLIDYHARQYDPSLRVFIQADSVIPNPYGVLDYNRYLYVHANPVRFTDPSGNNLDCGTLLCPEDMRDDAYVDVWDPINTRASDDAKELIKNAEINSNTSIFVPYEDINGYCTVGYGHVLQFGECTPEQIATNYSQAQIDEWFAIDIANAERMVRKSFQELDNEVRPTNENYPPGNPVPITQAQFDALVSFTFNAGGYAAWDIIMHSTITTHGSTNGTFDSEKFSSLMLGYTTPGIIDNGVYFRRKAEIDWFISGEIPTTLLR